MKTSFKVSKRKVYFSIEYITESKKPSVFIDNVLTTTKKDARTFIKMVRDFEIQIEKYLDSVKSNIKTDVIILKYLNAIESISSGLDIRSKMSVEELSERFASKYIELYNEALKFCEDTLKHVEIHGKNGSYMSDWKRYDYHNDLIKQFNLDVKRIVLRI